MTTWLSLEEAAALLKERGQRSKTAVLRMLREAGMAGHGHVWLMPNAPVVRGTQARTWLETPSIDVRAGTIVVPTRVEGRRTPEDRSVTVLVSREEIDRRWPLTSKPQMRKPGPGRKPDAKWCDLERLYELEVEARGVPSGDNDPGWQTLADVERFVAGALEDRKEVASESSIRKWAKRFMEMIVPSKARN